MALITDALGTAVRTQTVRQFANPIADFSVLGVDRCGADLLGQSQAIRLAVNNEDLARALYARRHGRHQANGTRAVDDN